MKQFSSSLCLLLWMQADASQILSIHEKATKLRGRRLISFSAFNKLISEGGADIARDGTGSSPTLEPVILSGSKTEIPTNLPPTTSPTKLPTQMPTRFPTDMPTTDASSPAPTDDSSTMPTSSPPSTSTKTTPKPTESPSVALSMSPTTSEPTKRPTAVPSTSKPITTAIPTSMPSTKPSFPKPESGGVGTTRMSYISLDVKGETASNEDTLDSICNVTQSYVNTITKRSFGKSTVTNVDCNVSMGHVHATTKTEFPKGIQAPDAITYDDYIQVVMTSDEAISTLPSKLSEAASSLGVDQEVKASVDASVHPPVIQLSFEDLKDSSATIRASRFATSAAVLVLTAFTT